MDIHLNVKGNQCRALVTAGASGIGRVIAETFLQHGAHVHICDVDGRALDDFREAHPEAGATLADVSDSEQVDRVFDELQAAMGGLDVLVNNAGIAGPTAPVEEVDPQAWRKTIDVNLNGAFYCTRRAVPLLKEAGGGSIVNIASSAALFGYPLRSPYAASKWALIGVTKTTAMELGPYGIRVNAICPGSVAGERIKRVIEKDAEERGTTPEEIHELYLKQVSLRRFIQPREVADTIIFLCSNMGRSISGQSLGVDGHTESLSSL